MGLFEAIFGKGAPKDDTQPKQAYYLSDDDAKTFGNIDYMRSNKVVRRTFAKKKGQTEHMESVRQISAMKKVNLDGTPVKGQPTNSTPSYSNGSTSSFGSSAPASATVPSPVAASAPPTASVPNNAPAKKSTPVAPASSEPTPRRKPASDDMDMFRNMAKNIRK